MIDRRGTGGGSMITRKSTHNQRIERLWRDVFTGVLSFYYKMFYFTEDQSILDPLNDVHISALHHIFLERINDKIQLWLDAWSNHCMRPTRTSPLRLWLSSQVQNPIGLSLNEDLALYGVEGIPQGDDLSGRRPIINPPQLQLSMNCQAQLQRNIPVTWTSTNHGIDWYLRALQIIEQDVNGN